MEFDTATLTALAVTYGFGLLSAIATLVVGLYLVAFAVKVVGQIMEKSETDPSLRSFIESFLLLKVMVYITALGMLGVEMTSFIAILGAAGLAVGMALFGPAEFCRWRHDSAFALQGRMSLGTVHGFCQRNRYLLRC